MENEQSRQWKSNSKSDRQAAIKEGRKHYQGKDCKHGHGGIRYITGVCVECAKLNASGETSTTRPGMSYSQANPGYKRNLEYNRLYGITLEDYDVMLDEQNHSCAICKAPADTQGRRLAVDHCHTTGKVRELLCHGCNRTLGHVKEDVQRLMDIATYIEKHR